MATLHAYYHEHVLLDSLINYAFFGNSARNTCWHFLASPLRMGLESILGNGARNTDWQYRVSLLGLCPQQWR
jgi:hypothetical protein